MRTWIMLIQIGGSSAWKLNRPALQLRYPSTRSAVVPHPPSSFSFTTTLVLGPGWNRIYLANISPEPKPIRSPAGPGSPTTAHWARIPS